MTDNTDENYVDLSVEEEELEDDESGSPADFAVQVSEYIAEDNFVEMFALFERHAVSLADRLKELDGEAGTGDALDELAERNPDWFAAQVNGCSGSVRAALLTRPRIASSVGNAVVPPPPPLPAVGLPEPDLGELPPPPPPSDFYATDPSTDSGPPPLVDEQEAYAQQLLQSGDLTAFFGFLAQDPSNIRVVANAAVGDELDPLAEADQEHFLALIDWLGTQRGYELTAVNAAFGVRRRLHGMLAGKERLRVRDTDPEGVTAEAPEPVELPPLPDDRQQRDAWRDFVRDGIASGDLLGFLKDQRQNLSMIVTVLSTYSYLGDAFDNYFTSRPEQLGAWFRQDAGVEPILRTRDSFARVLDAQRKVAQFESADAPPTAGDASRAIIGFAANNDFEGLFNYLLKAPRHAQAIIDSLDASAGPVLDACVSQNGQVFVAWLDWCSNADVQLALLSRSEIWQTVDAVRSPQGAQRRDRVMSMAETELPGIRPEEPDALDAAFDKVMGQVPGPRDEFSDPAAEALAEVVDTIRRVFQSGNLLYFFQALSGNIKQGYGPGLAKNLGADFWRQVEGTARSQPHGFARALADAGDPVVDEFLQSNSPILDALLRDQRRTAQFIELTDAHKAKVDQDNEDFVKNEMANGEATTWVAGGVLVLIGTDHDSAVERYVNQQPDRVSGTVRVKKGSRFGSAGALTFSDCPPAKQSMVTAAVKRFSSKKVVFEGVEAGPERQRPGRRRR